ncbi:hypothetical protein [Spongiactinospora sp. TRM90649]|uniref:hypothetical protein n=1 Tax=Spongiactinospora sp. TRM90649 TaxID=3031114 RepID=UPI0023F716E1|nr:hypothetical protein [Spongiactinospora sp. TRM90649]MDF5751945.1 hypothetical protein [Spongiactinospora sp. TRM90649]
MAAAEENDKLNSQQEAYRALGNLLERTGREDLPTITWMIGDGGAGPVVAGECHASDPIQRERDFYAWQSALGAVTWPDGIKRPGGIHLHAAKSDYEGVAVTVSADIRADEM